MNDIYHTDTMGDLPCILFLHGIMMSSEVWHNQIRYFSKNFRVVCVDLRGFGKSEVGEDAAILEQHVEDVKELIEKLNLRDVTLVGWSMGGAIAQLFAATHPQAIKNVVLVDTTPQLLASEQFPYALRQEDAAQMVELFISDFDKACSDFCDMISPEDTMNARFLYEICTKSNKNIVISTLAASAERTLHGYLPAIRTSAAIICGENDRVCPPEASRYLQSKIPGVTGPLMIMRNAGHAPFLTRPEEFNDLVESFIGLNNP